MVKASIVLLALGSCRATLKFAASEEVEVEASSQRISRSDFRGLLVHGTNFERFFTKLHFYPSLPESMFYQQVQSPTEIAVIKVGDAADPVSWGDELGPLKVVAIEHGDAGVQALNPEGGGVVVAEIVADEKKPFGVYTSIRGREKFPTKDVVSAPAPEMSPSHEYDPLMEPQESEVTVLSEDSFDDFIQANFAVVHFYHPWSVYCAKFSPEYTKASIELRLLDPEIKLGKINTNINRPLYNHERIDVREYSLVKIFRNGVWLSDYSDRRSARVIARTLLHAKMEQDRVAPPPPPPPPLTEPEDSEVSVLSADTIDDFIRADFAVVEFYVPWSSRYQSLFEEYTKASIELKRVDANVKLGKIDLTDGLKPLSERFDVSEFPTFKVFHDGVEVLGPHLTCVREALHLIAAMGKEMKGIVYPPPDIREIVDKTARFVAKNGKSFEERIQASEEGKSAKFNFMRPHDPHYAYYESKVRDFEESGYASKLEGMPKPLLRRPLVSEPEPKDGEVTVLSNDSIEDFITADLAVVQFCDSSSPICVKFSPEYTKASTKLKRFDPAIRLGKIDLADAVKWARVQERFGVKMYPVMKAFHNGAEVSDLLGSHNAAEIVEYLITVKSQQASPSPSFMTSSLGWLRAAAGSFTRDEFPAFGIGLGEVLTMLAGTPSEDPDNVSINASDVEVFPGRTKELVITGNGFSAADPPELRFEHAPDRGVTAYVVNRTTIRVEVHADSSYDGYIGPIKIKGIATGAAGLKIINPPVTVATVMPNFGASESDAQPY